jgi:hypothetical protein
MIPGGYRYWRIARVEQQTTSCVTAVLAVVGGSAGVHLSRAKRFLTGEQK